MSTTDARLQEVDKPALTPDEHRQKVKGHLQGILSAITFGLIPLFSVPLLLSGMAPVSVLVFRFGIAAVAMVLLMLVRGISFRIHPRLIAWYLALGILYFISAMLLLVGYRYMATGVATVLHFSYPIFVALIMAFAFGERLSPAAIVAIVMALSGVVLLSGVLSARQNLPFDGMVIVLTSGLAYALYIIVVNRSPIRGEHPFRLSFYVLSIAALLCYLYGITHEGIVAPADLAGWLNACGLAIIATVVSNVMLIGAIARIGSTPTAVMGALEPMTAMVVGTVVFGEILTFQGIVGVVLVLSAVVILIFRKR